MEASHRPFTELSKIMHAKCLAQWLVVNTQQTSTITVRLFRYKVIYFLNSKEIIFQKGFSQKKKLLQIINSRMAFDIENQRHLESLECVEG